MDAKVSIIVPAYNAEKGIARCLNSLLAQTYSNSEILIVNDGSIDNTPIICNAFAEEYACIKVLHQKNAGVSSARNAALNIATGDYIVFVDSDDVVKPGYIQELMRWSNFDFVTAGYQWQAPDLSWHIREFPDDSVSLEVLKKYPSKYMGKYYFGSPWATLMRREIIEKYHIRFDSTIHSGEDTLFIFQYLAHVSRIKIIPLCGYNYYFYPSSLANSRHKDYWKWKISVENTILEFFHPCNEEENVFLLQRCFDVLRDLVRDYSTQMNHNELFSLYQDPFFEKCISYKKKHGHFQDHMLIFAMEHKKYAIYSYTMQVISLWHRFQRRLKREFRRKAEVK